MTGSYDEWEEPRRLVERGERKLSDYGGVLPGIEPPDEWKRSTAMRRTEAGRRFRRDEITGKRTTCAVHRPVQLVLVGGAHLQSPRHAAFLD